MSVAVDSSLRTTAPYSPSVANWIRAAVLGSALLVPSLPAGIASFDPFLAVFCMVAITRVLPRHPLGPRIVRTTLPWIWLVTLASLAAGSLFGLGLPAWTLTTLLRDAFLLLLFFAVFGASLVYQPRVRGTVHLVITVSALVILIQGGYRPSGWFGNTNIAAHFFATGALSLLLTSSRTRSADLLTMLLATAAILRTGSFGSMAMLSAGFVYFFLQRVRVSRDWALRVLLALAVASLLVLGWFSYEKVDISGGNQENNAQRFERSGSLRTEIWTSSLKLVPEHPFGVGPYGVVSRQLSADGLEVHNDYLGYLVERGALGLLGLLGLGATFWRRAPPGGATRGLLCAIAVGGVFRETLHFRHLWIFLALCLAWDLSRGDRFGPLQSHTTRQGSETVGVFGIKQSLEIRSS